MPELPQMQALAERLDAALGGWTLDELCVVEAGGPDLKFDEEGDEDVAAGCCSASGGPQGALGLSLLTLGLVFWPRRRRR